MTTPPYPSPPPEPEWGAHNPDASGATTPSHPHGQPPPGYPSSYGYGYPGYSNYPTQRPTNGLAIASMVLGIIWIYWIGSILALIFGYIARQQIRERGEGGAGMAMAGIVLGWVGVGVLAIFIVFVTIAAVSGSR
ncbi:MAG TPA: DUF4190 domain-containing protein [Pseudonocardiaceae bacterium]